MNNRRSAVLVSLHEFIQFANDLLPVLFYWCMRFLTFACLFDGVKGKIRIASECDDNFINQLSVVNCCIFALCEHVKNALSKLVPYIALINIHKINSPDLVRNIITTYCDFRTVLEEAVQMTSKLCEWFSR